MIRIQIPAHLQRLANTAREVEIQVIGPVTQRTLLDALEAEYPVLRGQFAITPQKSAGHSSVSSPAERICLWRRQTHCSLRRWQTAKNVS